MRDQAAAHLHDESVASTDAAVLARLCKAAGDRLRLQVLRALGDGSFGVLELCHVFGMRQPAMSHHLKVLADAGLVSRRREGNHIYYRRSLRAGSAPLEALFDGLLHSVDALDLPAEQRRRLQAIDEERAAASAAFFAANADRFPEQQELIAAPEQYRDALLQLIDGIGIDLDTALELGPGTGWLLPELAARARRVIAVDSSAEMLDASRRTCAAAGIAELTFLHGDNGSLQRYRDAVDLAVVNMVLHHTPSPARVLRDLAAVLRPGGALLVSELAAHDQNWVREACGDFWLGLAADDLLAWTAEAKLVPAEQVLLALRNGFQVQLRLFLRPHTQE
jgi:ArsR family transcriptional regulator